MSSCGQTSLARAITAAGFGGTVQFTQDCAITLASMITLGQDVTIDGNGHKVTLSGGDAVPVLAVAPGVTAALHDLTITRGHFSSIFDAGGIWNAGTLTLTDSTVTGNSCNCVGFGGGITNAQSGVLTVANSTVGGNSGAIANAGTLTVANSTISGNSGATGGILNFSGSAVATLTNSILTGNGTDCGTFQASAIVDKGGNLADDASCTGTATAGLAALLGPLADNGGPTQTFALLPGSPALGAGLLGACTAAPVGGMDQRGSPRPDSGDTACDSGAYESQTPLDTDLGLTGMPADITTVATDTTGATVTFTPPTATDETGDSPVATVGCDHASGTAFALGATTVTCTATDSDDTPSTVSKSFTVTVTNPLPATSSISPASVQAAGAGFSLTLTGTGFVPASVVQLDGVALTTHMASFTQLTADVPANVAAHTALVTVVNPAPGGGTSNPRVLYILGAGVSLAGTPGSTTGTDASATTGGSGAGTAGSVTVSGSGGGGTVAVAQYVSNPGGTPSFASSGAYMDAYVAPGNTFTLITIVNCNLAGGSQVQWWNGTAWVAASKQSYDATTGCVTITVDSTTTPSLAQLGATPFGVANVPPVVSVPGAQIVRYGASLSFTVKATDAEAGDTLTLKASSLPAGLTFTDNGDGTGTVSGTATAGINTYTASFTANDGHSDSSAGTVQITVSPAPLTITASNQQMTYGGTLPALTATYGGFVNGDNAASLTTQPSCSTVAATSPAGSYDITCAGAAAPNYSINYQKGTLSINQASQVISFGPLPDHPLGDTPFTVSATGGGSGNPVTFSAGPAGVCTASGSNGQTITLLGIGTCTMTANQTGNANYTAASPLARSFTIAYPPLYLALTVASSPAAPVTTGSTVTTSFALGNHTALTETISGKTTLTYTGSHGSLSLSLPFTLTLKAGQTISRSASFTVTKLFPRGAYILSVAARDGSGDTASHSVSLTIS